VGSGRRNDPPTVTGSGDAIARYSHRRAAHHGRERTSLHEPIHDLHPDEARWTHVALRVDDIDATIDFYTSMTPLQLIDRHRDDAGFGAWLGMPGATNNPFILVVAQFLPGCDPYADSPKEVLAPFAHLGMELPTREAIDQIAARASAAGCLAMAPTQMPSPIGYICMVRDPDGNMIEFSWDQGVFATLRDRFGDPADGF
jgi:catechol 2,3-dioxygenase-like lactoylglutathione lyase family enzyme